jgi:hypothetical protein
MSQLVSVAANNSAFTQFDTRIPDLNQAADIVEAFRLYHYGKDNFVLGQEPADLSIHGHLKNIQDQLEYIEDLPFSQISPFIPNDVTVGDVTTEVREGFLWVDELGITDGEFLSGTVIYSNNMPTNVVGAVYHGTIWVDKDAPQTDPFNLSNFITVDNIESELAAYITITNANNTFAAKNNTTIIGGTATNMSTITLTGNQSLASRVRNITASTAVPTAENGNDGDIWLRYV